MIDAPKFIRSIYHLEDKVIFIILPFEDNIIVPFKSVLYVSIFIFFKEVKVWSDGCPYVLLFPTEIIATDGLTAFKNFNDEEVEEPWCPTLRTSDFKLQLFEMR